MFVDEATIVVRSGAGGRGAVSFRREKYIPRGGPDGGDGGRGGDVVFVVRQNVKTLAALRVNGRYNAGNGAGGAGRLMTGRDGKDVQIVVPPGTVVLDAESRDLLLDLTTPGRRSVLLQGGRGGKGNAHFKSSRIQAPRFAQPGEDGEERTVVVELRIIADIGFVGLPNAGKSTLLKVLTAAKPRVASYPFTTLVPNLGVMRVHDHDVVLADIPGLIAGASGGAGLGTRFLKHLSRTVGLAFVLDLSDDPVSALATLEAEVKAYGAGLATKESVVFLNKSDLDPEGELARRFFREVKRDRVVVLSAATGHNLEDAQRVLYDLATAPERGEQ